MYRHYLLYIPNQLFAWRSYFEYDTPFFVPLKQKQDIPPKSRFTTEGHPQPKQSITYIIKVHRYDTRARWDFVFEYVFVHIKWITPVIHTSKSLRYMYARHYLIIVTQETIAHTLDQLQSEF